MSVDPQTLYAMIELGRFLNQTVQDYQAGAIDAEELQRRWGDVRANVDNAAALWEQSKGVPASGPATES